MPFWTHFSAHLLQILPHLFTSELRVKAILNLNIISNVDHMVALWFKAKSSSSAVNIWSWCNYIQIHQLHKNINLGKLWIMFHVWSHHTVVVYNLNKWLLFLLFDGNNFCNGTHFGLSKFVYDQWVKVH